ncbi:MAG: hypothetical protein Kow0074_08110 [Candidatus Zixiibacteriota bacterium]
MPDAIFCYEYDPPIPTNLPVQEQVDRMYDGVLMECNESCAKAYGANRAADVLGRRLSQLAGSRPRNLNHLFSEMIRNGYRLIDAEDTEILPDGSQRHYVKTAYGFVENGHLRRLWGTFKDITDRKRAEQDLIECEGKFRSITQNASDSIFIKDQHRRYTFVNRAMLELLKRPESSVLGKTPAEVFGPEQAAIIDEVDDRTFAGHTVDETRTLWIGDQEFHFHTVQTPLTRENGTVTSIMGVVRDVTQSKMAEIELRAQKARYQMLFEAANDFVILSDMSDPQNPGPIIDASQLACERLGYTRDEIKKLRPTDIMTGVDDDRDLRDAGMSARDQSLVFDRNLITRSGEVIPVEIRSRIFEHGGKRLALTIGRDISRRKSVLDQLRKSEELARIVLNATLDLVVLTDAQGTIIDLNDRMTEALGGTRENLIGTCVFDHFPPHVAEQRRALMHDVLRDRKPLRYLDRPRSGVVYEVSLYPIEDQRDGSCRLVVFVHDATEEHQTAEHLRESEERFRALFENSPDVIAVTDLDGKFLDINRTTHGYNRDDVIGTYITDYLTPELADRFRRAVRRAVDTGTPQSYEAHSVSPSGQTVHWHCRVSTLKAGGKAERLIINTTDISDRKEWERALHEARLFTDNLVNTASVMIVGLDTEGTVTLFNPAGEHLTGYSRDDLLGQNWFDLLVPRNRYEYVYEQFLQGGCTGLPPRLEHPILTKDGRERIISWSNSELREGDRVVGMISFGIDTTERIEAERKMRELNERLEMEHEALLEKNIALKQILAHLEQDKSQYKHEICDSIEKLLEPVMATLTRTKGRLKPRELAELRTRLNAILQKDIDAFASNLEKLSPRELDVLNLIRAGRSSKEIADRLHLSLQTVHKHRGSIRNKLQLSNKDVNLATYLRSHAKGASL